MALFLKLKTFDASCFLFCSMYTYKWKQNVVRLPKYSCKKFKGSLQLVMKQKAENKRIQFFNTFINGWFFFSFVF